jgi:hypothetical protein
VRWGSGEVCGHVLGVHGKASLHRRHAHSGFVRTVRGKGADSPTKKVVLFRKLLSLLQSSKVIFQASENSTNFCVNTRNQEQPIFLKIGRQAVVNFK